MKGDNDQAKCAAPVASHGERDGLSLNERRLRALHELAALTVAGKVTDDILDESVEIIVRTMGVYFAGVFLYDEAERRLRLVASCGIPEPLRIRITEQAIAADSPGIAAETARSGEAVIVEDLRSHTLAEYARSEVIAAGCRSLLSVPAVGNEGLVAVLQVVALEARSFAAEDVALLRTIGHQLAQVIERSRADEELRRRTRQLECLNAVGRAASESVELGEVLRSALDTVVATVPADGGFIYLVEPESGDLVRAAHTRIPPGALALTERFPRGHGLTGRVAETGVAEAVNDAVKYPNLIIPGAVDIGVRSAASAPLRGRQGILGAVSLAAQHKDAFSDDAVRLLEAIGAQLGVAIENARLYHEARNAERYLKNVLTATPHAIVVVDRELHLAEFNEAAEGLLGVRRPSDVGRLFLDLWPSDEQASVAEAAESVLAGEGVDELETEIVGGGGERIPCRVALSGLPDETGQIAGLVAVATDLRKQRGLEEQLVKAERLHALGEMASGVAHDFNNVLAGILGRTQLLLRRADDERFANELRTIEKIILDGAETVRRIQEFTHVEPGRQFVRASPKALVRDALAMTRHRWSEDAAERGVHIRIETDLRETPPVAGSPAELREVIVNLILNAADALTEGGVIQLATFSDDEWVYIRTADDGIGMTHETAMRVFEPFFTTKGMGGTGLGLSVSYGIVLRHGGDIAVESAPGEGATFTIKLPFAPAASAPPPDEPQPRGARILVIDDEEAVREAIRDVLDILGHEARVAAGGEEGIVAFSKGQYDLVITDLGMPDISGWEVAAAIKQKSPDTFVALLTGWNTQMDSDRLADGAVDMLLGKPLAAAELEKVVNKALEAREHSSRE